MKTEMILPMSLNMRNVRLFSTGIRITRNALFILAALMSVLMTVSTFADTHYVDANRPDDSGDGLSWATAEKTIQAAIDASTAGDKIVVTNGVYAPILTSNQSIKIQSVNGSDVTIIDGGGTARCAYLGFQLSTNTILSGFTLRNGNAYSGAGSYSGTLNNCKLIGNTAYDTGGGAIYGTLDNCTLEGNSAWGGGGASYSTLNNCTLLGNSASYYGGGAYGGALNNCTLMGNRSSSYGGGASYGILSNCTLTANIASSFAGGVYDGTLNNCTLTGNSASSGGGSYNGTLNNCTLTRNSASSGGGSYNGALNNCTLTENRASSGGGAYSGTLNNCIVWGNTFFSGVANNYVGGTFNYSCTTPLPSGTKNLSSNPLFRLPVAGDFRLSTASPCLNAGTNGYAVGSVDVLGNARIQDGTVDMGAYEGAGMLVLDASHLSQNVVASGGVDGVALSWDPPAAGGAVRYRVYRMDLVTGNWMPVSDWISVLSFLDKRVLGGMIFRYSILTAFDAQLVVISGLSASAEGQRNLIPRFYVDASRPDDAGDGGSWATAKKTIQAAIGVSAFYDTILVTNGVYAPISTANKTIAIRSVNGSDFTVIDGCGANRCATMGSSSNDLDTILFGFTLRNGSASAGGGSCYGTLNICALTGNSASSGGGSYCGTLNNCILEGNSASSSGGGSYYGTLNNCTLAGNRAASSGGGSYYGMLNNCIVWGNILASGVTNNYLGATFKYSCTTPIPSGTGNRSVGPLFRLPAAGDFRLSPGSPCLNAGTNGYAVGAVDLLGNARIQNSTVDMGSCEGAWTLVTDSSYLACNVTATGRAEGIAVSWEPPVIGGAVLYRVCRMDIATGQWIPFSGWMTERYFLDTRVFNGVTYRYSIVTAFDTRLDVISGSSAAAEGQRTVPQFYVDASRPDDAGDGRSWAMAKRTIQAAIDVSAPNDTIFVTNGVYGPISTANKAITIQSVNGMDVTIIDGGKVTRCAVLGGSSSHTNTVLVGFTLRNGYASSSYGGGSYYGTLCNCTLTGNSANSGGGSYYGILNNCTLSGNSVSSYGGGAYNGTLNNCTLTGNSSSYCGGGAYYSTLNNCVLAGNRVSYRGGGSYDGTLNNCTVQGNSTCFEGGGAYAGKLKNCIVWGNTFASGEMNNYVGGTFSNSCTEPLPSGTNNLAAAPLFRLPAAGDFRLSPGSPCLNAGTNSYVIGAVDLLGNARIQNGTVDMGAYEGAGTLVTDSSYLARNVTATGLAEGIAVSWEPPVIGGAVLYRVCRMDIATGQWMPFSGWMTERYFLDTRVFNGVTYRYSIVTAFDTRLDVISGLSAAAEGQRTVPQYYVDASRPDDAGDGRSWAMAKRTIQSAIDISVSYDTILVTNGVYAPISTANKTIMIRSVNGAEVTIIDAGWATRCAIMGNSSIDVNTVLEGLTLRNGYGSDGGGSYYGTLNNCTLTGNSTDSHGGGAFYGILNNCMLVENKASTGGGAYGSILNNCMLMRNSALSSGGGAGYCTLNNCTLAGNRASSGGGAYSGTLNNCTLSGNSASSGGGSYAGMLNNCIVWGNTLYSGETNNYEGCTLSYSCTTPLPLGTGNLSSDPMFRLAAAWDFRLSPGSPCLNAGTNSYAVGSVDGLGNPRIQDGMVDIGACEGMGTLVTEVSSLARNIVATGGTDGVAVSWVPPLDGGVVLYRVCRMEMATGQWTPVSGWISGTSFLDTQLRGGVTYCYAIVSAFDTRFDVVSGLSEAAEAQRTLPQYYVDASRSDDSGDGRSWATAKRTIQAAIDCSTSYDTILVTNGVYAPILSERKAVMIQSVNGASVTIIDAGVKKRCAILGGPKFHINSDLAGFTLRNGIASAQYGGGAYYGTLNNCTLSGNRASSDGGGAYRSMLNNCILSGNNASSGGGASDCTLNNCTLTGNSASYDGGGSYASTLNNCALSGNRANNDGGGSCYGTLNNCTLWGNSASYDGGGASGGRLNNCTLQGNSSTYGAGGASGGTLKNCIVWGNTRTSGVTNNYDVGTFSNSCTTPLPSGTGNITNSPNFMDAANSNFLLRVGSPCINAGSNAFVVGSTDLVGNPRIQNNTVDMGAYEMLSLVVTLDWQNGGAVTLTNALYGQAYQLPPAVFADAMFLGWWTLPNGLGMCILPETVVSMTSNHTLYAKWDVNSVVGTTGLVWQTEGDSLWFVQTNAVTQGLSAMQSGAISDNQTSWIGTTVTGPGHFSFGWRVSSEGGYDVLAFAVDGVENRAISGTKKDEWQVVEVAFTNAGVHEFRWTYSKDDSVSEGQDCGWLDRVAWIPAPPIIPGNPNVSSTFLDTVTQAQIDALVAGLRAAHPDVTDAEIAKKFEDADLFGFTGTALVGVGTDALVRFNPSITLATLSVVEGDPRTLVVTVAIGNNIDLTPAEALSRLGEAINSRMRGVFRNSLSAGASETILTPALTLDGTTGVVTATFTLENPAAPSGFLRMSLRK
jgi:hypothetical protein